MIADFIVTARIDATPQISIGIRHFERRRRGQLPGFSGIATNFCAALANLQHPDCAAGFCCGHVADVKHRQKLHVCRVLA